MPLNYNHFTLGIEEEYMVLDPTTQALKSHQQQIVLEGAKLLPGKVKAEMHQAVVEVGTAVCQSIVEAEADIIHLRQTVNSIANSLGYSLGASGTHPFSHWNTQLITEHVRYSQIVNELQEAARSNLVFGLHVHVGMPNRKTALHIANSARNFLPHLYALSANSPFWVGRKTGYKSYRTKIFDKFPRTGIPDYFESIEAYDNYIELLIKTNCIDNAKKIWWDLRVHPQFNTVELRICDVPMTVKETIAISALFQSICVKLYQLQNKNLSFIHYHRALLNENKWRAGRYGTEGKMIDFGKEAELPTQQLILELLDFVDDISGKIHSQQALQTIPAMLLRGTGADRQLQVYENTNSLQSVVLDTINQFLKIDNF